MPNHPPSIMPRINCCCRDIYSRKIFLSPFHQRRKVNANERFTVREHKSSFNLKRQARKHIISEIFFALLTPSRLQNFTSGSCRKSTTRGRDMIYEISFTHMMYAAGLRKSSRWIIDNFSTTLHRSLPNRCI